MNCIACMGAIYRTTVYYIRYFEDWLYKVAKDERIEDAKYKNASSTYFVDGPTLQCIPDYQRLENVVLFFCR